MLSAKHTKTFCTCVGEALIHHKCYPYLVVLETRGLGEAAELGLVGAAETGLEAGEERGKNQ